MYLYLWRAAALLIVLSFGAFANADKSAVSPTRLKLPSGPGSLTGLGENVEPNLAMGLLTYRVKVELPEGFASATPTVDLVYASSNGNSIVGIGWDLPVPSIERRTANGLPRYSLQDQFVADGSTELVEIDDGMYRARFEGGFVRYHWRNREDGAAGYWVAEYPDGSVAYFGATSDGDTALDARVEGPKGTFRYLATETVSALGHRVEYSYDNADSSPLLQELRYGFVGGQARYTVKLGYEQRPDWLSDGRPGFLLTQTRRLVEVQVLVEGQQLRRYELAYDDSPAASRLAAVRWFGEDDDAGPFPVVFSFDYTGQLMGDCAGDMCATPAVHHFTEALPVDFQTGDVELVDLDGDATPDIVDTAGVEHRIFLNRFGANGGWKAATSEHSSARLSQPEVVMFDLNGDGYADLLDSRTRRLLVNRGQGDWTATVELESESLPDLSADANARLIELTGDGRIDVLHSDDTSTWYWENRGGGEFALVEADVQLLGAAFVNSNLQLADINGDSLLDAVLIAEEQVSARVNLGLGRWSDGWTALGDVPAGTHDGWQLADVNGDALADLVRVVANEVQYALNVNGTYFGELTALSSHADLAFPERTADVSVRFADMNGNGTTDVVWFTPGGNVSFLELFAVRPNLLSRVRNGLGLETRIEYGSSVAHQMQAEAEGEAWKQRPPFPVLTVDKLSIWNEATQTEQEQRFKYRNGYYSPTERQFQGFAQVEVVVPGDSHGQQSTTVVEFDVGDEDPYRRGLPLAERTFSDASPLSETTRTYGDCAVADAEDTETVRYVCLEHTRQLVQEAAEPSDWVTIEQRFAYDAYGNRTLEQQLGVTEVGGAGCGPCNNEEQLGLPCGPQCLGDEQYVETTFIEPANTQGWLLRLPHTRRSYGVPGSDAFTEQRFYYDGPALVGLAHGEATAGLLTRTQQQGDDEWIDVERLAYTDQGMVAETRDALEGRRRFSYVRGNLLRSETVYLDGYALQQTVSHDKMDRIVESTPWQLLDGDDEVTPPPAVGYGYDAFSRVTAIARPGEDVERASERFTYVLASPLSRIERRLNSESSQSADVLEVDCYDSAGRKLQSRTAVGDGTYQVTEHVEFSPQGFEAKLFSSYLSKGTECTPFADQPHTEQFFDAKGRIVRAVLPASEQHSSPSESRTDYAPLTVRTYDPEAVAYERDTPTVELGDGLGRRVVVRRFVNEDESYDVRSVHDELGRLAVVVDPLGNRKRQQYDRLGRVVRVEDPDSGIDTFRYDAAGNLIARTDARGATRRLAHDALGRVVAEWDEAEPELSRIEYLYDRSESCEKCTHVAGRLASIVYPVDTSLGVDTFGYDARGRQTYVGRFLEQTQFDFGLVYDNADRIIEKHYPGGERVQYELDGPGRITRVPGFVEQVEYAPSGLMSAMRLANGVVNEWHYDGLQQLSQTRVYSSEHDWLDLAYHRNRVGNIVQIDDALADDQERSFNARFEYDALQRLQSTTLEPGTELEEQLEYEFDAANRLRSKTSNLEARSPAHVGEYTYGGSNAGPNAVTQAGGVELEYDPAGHLTRRGHMEFSWDYLGRLREVRDRGQLQQRLSYGPGHDRLKNHDQAGFAYTLTPDFEVRDSVATVSVELDGRRIASLTYSLDAPTLPDLAPAELEHDKLRSEPDGQITAGDAWLSEALRQGLLQSDSVCDTNSDAGCHAAGQLDVLSEQTVQRQLAASAQALLAPSEPSTTYYHHDHLGSVIASTDQAGQRQTLAYSYPFGQLRDQNVGWQRGDPRYTGKERDPGSGLVDFGVRLYDPSLGIWARPDPRYGIVTPAALEGGFGAVNRYAFSPNPVNSKDVNGEFAQWIVGGVVGAVTGGAIEYVSQKLQGKETDWGSIGTAAALGAAEGVVTSGLAAAKNSAKLGKLLVDNKSKIVGSVRKTAEAGKQTLGKARAAVHKVMPTSRCAGGVCPCFVADTPVQLAQGDERIAIAEVELGQRVGPPSQACAQVDFNDWEVVHLRMVVNTEGIADELALQLLRPRGWTRGPPGLETELPEYIDVSLPELNVSGTGYITFRGPAPQLLPGAACPVIGLVRHTANEVVTLGLSSGEYLTATPEHPLFSLSRNSWVPAARTMPGEQLETVTGAVTVNSVEARSGPVEVFNLEVFDAHQYFVGNDAIRAHNTYGDVAGGVGAKAAEGPKFTYRGDNRAPSEIFKKGFEPRGASTDLHKHAIDNTNPPSAYISTSTSEFVAKGFGPNVYVVRNRTGIDVNKALGSKTPFPDEVEIAMPGKVPGSDVRAVTVGNQSILNPDYKP